MSSPSRQELRLNLRAWAAELSAKFTGLPVLVRTVCGAYGVAIEKRESVPPTKAFLELDLAHPDRATILLPRKRVTEFERFCVAHELAHYLLYRGFNVAPEGRSEYWIHEELCDDFARHLLMPSNFLPHFWEKHSLSQDYLGMCDDLSVLARVPWTQAGRRISSLHQGISYSRIRERDASTFEVIAVTAENHRGRGRRIKTDSPLGKTLTEVKDLGEGPVHRFDALATATVLTGLGLSSPQLPAALQIRYRAQEFHLAMGVSVGSTEGE